VSAAIQFVVDNSSTYFIAVREHVMISVLAVFFAGVIGIPLGIVSTRFRHLKPFITGTFSTLRIIPSLAVLILMIPLVGIGLFPAIIALVFLAMPPILINTMLAFDSLPDSVLEAARGMGMGPVRVFFRISVPLAMPLIMTGIRTSSVEVIASATLAAYIGAGGLGTIIFTGLGLMRSDLLLAGGLTVAMLSLLTGFILSRVEHHMFRYQRVN